MEATREDLKRFNAKGNGKVKVMLDDGAILPIQAHKTDAGYDFFAKQRIVIFPRDFWKTDTGVHIQVPENVALFVKSKSGLMGRGLLTDGTVDCGYTGEISVVLFNLSDQKIVFESGNKIAQAVFVKIITPEFEIVDSFEKTERGDGGFGSTGL